MKQTQYEKMTQTPVPQLILTLSAPTILSMLATTIYNLADTAFVGTLGNSASGAIGVVFGFMSILQAIGFLFGQGGGNLMSRRLGEKNLRLASQTASTAFFGSLVFGAVLALFCFLRLDSLIRLLGSTETIAPFAKTYIYYILAAAPLVVSSFTLNNLLRYEGKAALGMIGLLTGGVLNIGGDALFIFVFRMGIAGAGLATAISQTISFCILLAMFLSGKTQTGLSVFNISFANHLFSDILTTGVPALLRQGLHAVCTILTNMQAAKYASDAGVAAMSIVGRIGFFMFAVALGIGQGFQPVCAFNFGAGKYDRVRRAFGFAVFLSEVLLAALTVPVLLLSGNLVKLFRDDINVIALGTRALRIFSVTQLFLPPTMMTEMLMQGSGKKGQASFLSSLRGGLLLIPALVLLPLYRGMNGVEEAQPLAFVLSLLPAVLMAKHYFKELGEKQNGNTIN